MPAPIADKRADELLAQFPGYVLRRTANAMMSEFAVRLAPLNLRISEVSLLQLVGESQDLTSSEIGKALDIQRANMVPLLNRLEEADLIERRPINGRSTAIVLTETGLARLEQSRSIIAAFETDLMDRIPAEHRDHFMPALYALWKPEV